MIKYLTIFIIGSVTLALIFQFILANYRILQIPGYDYSFFYRSGERVLKNTNPYTTEDLQLLRYPPTFLLIFDFFAQFPLIQSQFLFFFANLIVFICGIIILYKSLAFLNLEIYKKICRYEIMLLLTISILLFFPFRYLLGSLHIHGIIFFSLSLFVYNLIRKRDFFAGFFLGLAGSLTISPLFLILLLLIVKRYRVVFYAFINLLAILFITGTILGFEIYQLFIPSIFNALDFGANSYLNQSITTLLIKITESSGTVKLITIGLQTIGLIVTATLVFRNNVSRNTELVVINVGIMLMLLFSPFSWQYHYVLSLIPLFFCIYFWKVFGLSKNYLFLIVIAFLLIGFNIRDTEINLPFFVRLILLSHVFWGGLLVLFLSYFVLYKLRTGSEE